MQMLGMRHILIVQTQLENAFVLANTSINAKTQNVSVELLYVMERMIVETEAMRASCIVAEIALAQSKNFTVRQMLV